jgi:hypothetical protein
MPLVDSPEELHDLRECVPRISILLCIFFIYWVPILMSFEDPQ